MSAAPLLSSILIFLIFFLFLIFLSRILPGDSSSVISCGWRIGLKILIYKEPESGQKHTLFLGFSWLKTSLLTFLLLIPLTAEPCWKSSRVVVSLLQTLTEIPADRSSLFHLPRANSPYASTLLEVRESVGFLASFFCRRLLEFQRTEAGFLSFSRLIEIPSASLELACWMSSRLPLSNLPWQLHTWYLHKLSECKIKVLWPLSVLYCKYFVRSF